MRTIAFISEKGGVGKTTTTLNVAAAAGQGGRRVLVVDADPQGNASHVLAGGEKPDRPSLAEVLVNDATAQEAIGPSVFPGIDLLPADHSLADAVAALSDAVGRERRLRRALASLSGYDLVLIDTAPTRSLLTTNVLNAASELVIPMAPGLFGVLGLVQLTKDVADVREYLDNRDLRIAGIVLTMAERTAVALDVERQLREEFGDLIYKTTIPRNVKLEEAHSRHVPIFDYSPRSAGATAYRSLAAEIFGDVQSVEAVEWPGARQHPAAHDDAA